MSSAANLSTLLVLSPGFAANEADENCLPAQQSLILSINRLYPELRVIILAFEYPFTSSTYHWHGNTVIAFGGRNKGGMARIFRWVKIRKKMRLIHKEYTLCGILSFWLGQAAFVGSGFASKYHLKHFTWILGQDAKSGNRYARRMRLQAGSLIAMSDFLANTLKKNYGVKPLHVIPNGIDPTLFEKAGEMRDIDIICVGSLIPLKQFHQAVDIVAELLPHLPELRVVICGDGPEKQHIQTLIEKHGAAKHIHLAGELPHSEVLRLMQKSKLMLHPSSYEGFSGACLEALYAGVHVISFQQPMEGWIRHWHIARNTENMKEQALQLLTMAHPVNDASLPYQMKDSARRIVELFL